MKKSLIIVLPVLFLFVIAGLALSRTQNDGRTTSISKRWSFGPGGYRLGLNLSQIDPAIKKNLKISGGLLVEDVEENSPAEKAGIKKGDILLKLAGKDVEDARDVREMLSNLDKAEPMDVEVLRNGEQMQLKVTPEKHDLEMAMVRMGGNYIGVQLQELDSDLASYFQTDPNAGVLVAAVEDDSPAQKAGVRSGDVITQLNNQKVNNAEDVRRLVNKLDKDQTAELTVLRHGKSMKITVKPEERKLPAMGRILGMEGLPDLHDPQWKQDMDELRDQVRTETLNSDEIRQLKQQIENDLKKSIDELRQEIETLKKSQ